MAEQTFKKGDYVCTAGMTEGQYHAVADAFIAAGAGEDWRNPARIGKGFYLMWDDDNDIDAGPEIGRCSGRELSLCEVIEQ